MKYGRYTLHREIWTNMKYGRYLVTMTQRDMDKYEIWKVPCYDDTERYRQI